MAFLICFNVQRIDDGQRSADDSKPFAMHLLIWNPQHKQKTARSNCLVHFFPFPHPKSYCYKNTRWELLAYYDLETLGEGVSLTTRNTREADTGSTYCRGWDWFGCVINPLVLSSGEFSCFKYLHICATHLLCLTFTFTVLNNCVTVQPVAVSVALTVGMSIGLNMIFFKMFI